jgi:hypothetical protein
MLTRGDDSTQAAGQTADESAEPGGSEQPAIGGEPPTSPETTAAADPKEQISFKLDSFNRGAKVVLQVEGQPDVVLCETTPCKASTPKQRKYGTLLFVVDDDFSHAIEKVDLLADRIDKKPDLVVARKKHEAKLERKAKAEAARKAKAEARASADAKAEAARQAKAEARARARAAAKARKAKQAAEEVFLRSKKKKPDESFILRKKR